MAEDAARELPNLPLEDALMLVHLYAERGSPKYEPAALRWLERYLTEGTPRLQHFAEITARLAKGEFEAGGVTPGCGRSDAADEHASIAKFGIASYARIDERDLSTGGRT